MDSKSPKFDIPVFLKRITDKFKTLGDNNFQRTFAMIGLVLKTLHGIVLGYLQRWGERLKGAPRGLVSPWLVPLVCSVLYRSKTSHGSGRSSEKRPRVLLLRFQKFQMDRTQLSNEIGLLDNTLMDAGITDFQVLTYDLDLKLTPFNDFQFIKKCFEYKPDIIVISSWGEGPRHPSRSAIRFVRHQFKIPAALIWWDTCSTGAWDLIQQDISEFDYHIVTENPKHHGFGHNHPLIDRFITLWPPLDPKLFYNTGGDRDILVSFIGNLGSYRSYRQEYLEYLIKNGVDGRFSQAGERQVVQHEEYANIIHRSKMCINFSYSSRYHQFKGRILEALLCGCLLLESENDQASTMFEPMVDYVPYCSKEDLLDKIAYFQDHPDEMSAIAKRGMQKAQENYTGAKFWEALFREIERKPVR